MAALSSATIARNVYDHNTRNAVGATGDPYLFEAVPAATQRTWLRRGPAKVVSFGPDTSHLIVRIQKLERTHKRLRNVCVDPHNTLIAHNAFHGQTPIEMFCGDGSHLAEQFASKRAEARDIRLNDNRAAVCGGCPTAVEPPQLVP